MTGKNIKLGLLLLIPATLLLILVLFYPIGEAVRLSMMNYELISPQDHQFIFFGNFVELAQDAEFFSVLGFSFLFTGSSVFFSYCFALIVALLINSINKFKGMFRGLFLLPWVIPPAITATSWKWILNDQYGVINRVLQQLGVIGEPVSFLGSSFPARISVILISAWQSFPFIMVVLLAGMMAIPKELYEAASVSGANYFQKVRHITLPLLKHVSLVSTTLMFIWTFNNFQKIYLLTEGGPGRATFVLPILTYYTAFNRTQLGYASAMSVLMAIVMLVMAVVYLRVQSKSGYGFSGE